MPDEPRARDEDDRALDDEEDGRPVDRGFDEEDFALVEADPAVDLAGDLADDLDVDFADEDLAVVDLAELAREPPPRPPLAPLEDFEAAVRFAIIPTVVACHHTRHSCHTGNGGSALHCPKGSCDAPAMVALFRRLTEPTRREEGPTRVSPLWIAMTHANRALVRLVGRLEITGTIPPEFATRPGLIAANHIGMFDPFVLAAALRESGVNPRFLLTGGLLDAPVVGWVLRKGGAIRVDRGKSNVIEAFARTTDALGSATGPMLVYPEGRISREPGLWPERGKTGVARMSLAAKVPVMVISQWGAHEAMYWGTEHGVSGWRDLVPLAMSWLRAIRNRPVFRVHFGPLVDLSDLTLNTPGDAVRAHARIMHAITENLVPLRADEPDRPRFQDPTRPQDGKSPWRPSP